MMKKIMKFAQVAATRQDLILITLLMLIVFMIIIPLPTFIVDSLLGVNFSIAVTILIFSTYIKGPSDFLTLPGIILICTLLRLGLSIATTRLILLQGDAGQIVETFGRVVVGDNLVVGLVIFLIITAVQFMVITKGSERVAEVGARFSLDALPGKQMAIDADLRAGEIDADVARQRRNDLQKEFEFFGSMDGAMKFVKGDAIAGLIIAAVNLFGGIGIGLSEGMALSAAIGKYSILTIGDGLVSQIPALMISIGCGTVMTRVSSDESNDLGSGIAAEISASPRTLQVAGVVIACFALVPGFPWFIFVGLGCALISLGYIIQGRSRSSDGLDALGAGGEAISTDAEATAITLAIASNIAVGFDAKAFRNFAQVERANLLETLGVPFPPFRAIEKATLADDAFELSIDGVPVATGVLPAGYAVVLDSMEHVALAGVEPQKGLPLFTDANAVLAAQEARATLTAAGIETLSPEAALARYMAQRLPAHVGHFLGIQETRSLLSGIQKTRGELVSTALELVPLPKLSDILRRTTEEGVSVRSLRLVLESLIEWGPKEKDTAALVDHVRVALSRQICHRYAVDGRVLPTVLVESKSEEIIRESVRHSANGSYISLTSERSRRLLFEFKQKIGVLGEHHGTPVVFTQRDLRRVLWNFLYNNGVNMPVLAHQELAKGFHIQPIATISIR